MRKPLITIACAALMSSPIQANTNNDSVPNIFLVHGAHFTAQSWKQVQKNLPDEVNTIAVNLPGRSDYFATKKVSLEASAAVLCSEISKVEGDKTVVGHSQAGAVINATLAICPDPGLKKLIYVTAVSPLNGETAFEQLSEKDAENYFKGVKYNKPISLLEISNSEGFLQSFAPKANTEQRKWLTKHAVPEPSTLGNNPLVLNQAKFKSMKKYYIFANQDKVISLSSQQKIAARMGLAESYSLDSGHLPMLTHPKELASILEKISAK